MRELGDRTKAALEEVYAVFALNRLPSPIVVCPCCISADELKVMIGTRLKALTFPQLEEYLHAVLLTSGSAADFRYFLPRLLDLNAHAHYDFQAEWEILLGKLSLGEWQDWPVRERESLMEFLRAYFDELIRAPNMESDEIDSFLCGLARGGVDLIPFLDRLSQPDADEAFYALSDRNAASLMKGKLANSFWKDHREAGVPILRWLKSEESEARIARRWGSG